MCSWRLQPPCAPCAGRSSTGGTGCSGGAGSWCACGARTGSVPTGGEALDFRICQLQAVLERTENEDQRLMLNERIHMLSTMLREARELAVLTERYYERGYRRNAKYTL